MCVVTWLNQLLQNLATINEVISILWLLSKLSFKFLLNIFYRLESYHHSTLSTCRVLDITNILWLAIYGGVTRKTLIDPVPASSVPTSNTFVRADKSTWDKVLHAVEIELFNEVIHKFPPIYLSRHSSRASVWLITKTNAAKEEIKPWTEHTCLSKMSSRHILRRRKSWPQWRSWSKIKSSN